MEILYFLIPISLILVVIAVGVFFWAVRSGQFDDLEGPAWRILFDDEPMPNHDAERAAGATQQVRRLTRGNGGSAG